MVVIVVLLQEVFSGQQTTCTVGGLHYGATYKARVKAFNSAGDMSYSDPIGFTTPRGMLLYRSLLAPVLALFR